MTRLVWSAALLACLTCATTTGGETDQAARWQTTKTDAGWRLLKEGEPFYGHGHIAYGNIPFLVADD